METDGSLVASPSSGGENLLRRKWPVWLLALVLAGSAGAADFSPGDRVALSKDTPLFFSRKVMRTGRAGEQFTVIAVRAEEHLVFLAARDPLGAEIALNVGDDALLLLPKKAGPSGPADAPGALPKDLPGATAVPAILAARPAGPAHERARALGGSTEKSEAAVLAGLGWLRANQNADGSWGPNYRGAMTGFALLAFLGHGETPASAEYGPAVQKGIDWLLVNGGKSAGRLSMATAFNQSGVYEHGIATYALAEYYALTRDERVVELLRKALGHIVAGQGPDGGWMYAYDHSQGDTSVSCWQIQALKAAHLSGLKVERIEEALDLAMRNLERVQDKDGSFGYRTPRPDSYSLTGAGAYCTWLWDRDKDVRARRGVDFLVKQLPTRPLDYRHEKADLYAWYYSTHACYMVGGQPWQKWNPLLREQLIRNQSADGSWRPVAGKSPGGELQRDPEGAGPFYRTCLCVLMLEVYYRYLPSVK